jgi:NADP-dependent 3-hydroxy acid dehydrogenase YdfG
LLQQAHLPAFCADIQASQCFLAVFFCRPDAGVDVLVNNAGLSRNDASLFDGNTASW